MKPILTIKQKCRECLGKKEMLHKDSGTIWTCPYCSGTGEQETEIYALRDFDECEDLEFEECPNCDEGYSHHDCGEDTCCCIDTSNNVECDECNGKGNFMSHELCCKGTGYKIPKEYEPYEIKKVSGITKEMYILYNDRKIDGFQFDKCCRMLEKHNFKEDDNVVIVNVRVL